MTSDRAHMARALALAERGRGTTSPNPMVGAVIVNDEGVVVGRGSHEFAGGPHAEIHALRDAGERARGATLYCTLEPCSHTGRTGPCAPQVVAAGIRRAVIAMEDPNPLVSGSGIALLRSGGLDVEVGVLGDQAARLNRPFLTVLRRRRPFVIMKVALSRDAKVAAAPGQRTTLTGEAAGRRIHRDRAEVDALAVGSGTVLVDDPLLTARGAFRRRPLVRVIFDRRLRTPPDARVLSTSTAGPVIIVTSATQEAAAPDRLEALKNAGAQVEAMEDRDGSFLARALERLAAGGVASIIVEGGPSLHQAFWDAAVVDSVQMYVTPHAVGAAGLSWIALPENLMATLDNVRVTPMGEDFLVEGDVHRAD